MNENEKILPETIAAISPIENIENIENIGNIGNIENADVIVKEEIDEHTIKLDEETVKAASQEVSPDGKAVLDTLKVAADPQDISPEDRKRNVKKLAGAISHALRIRGEINVRAFGNAAIGKACKALAIAGDYIEDTTYNKDTHKLLLSYSPAFITTKMGDNTLTGIGFVTFASEKTKDIDLSKIKSVLMVKADPKDLDPEERRSKARKLAGAIAHSVEENKICLVRAFGNSAIGKACKALAIARGFTATRGEDLFVYDDFIVANMGDKERTGIVFVAFSNSFDI